MFLWLFLFFWGVGATRQETMCHAGQQEGFQHAGLPRGFVWDDVFHIFPEPAIIHRGMIDAIIYRGMIDDCGILIIIIYVFLFDLCLNIFDDDCIFDDCTGVSIGSIRWFDDCLQILISSRFLLVDKDQDGAVIEGPRNFLIGTCCASCHFSVFQDVAKMVKTENHQNHVRTS